MYNAVLVITVIVMEMHTEDKNRVGLQWSR